MKFLYGRNEESSGISVVDNVFHGVMDEEGCGAIREKFAVLSSFLYSPMNWFKITVCSH